MKLPRLSSRLFKGDTVEYKLHVAFGYMTVCTGLPQDKYGRDIHDTDLPGQCYIEAFEERLVDGMLTLETPYQVKEIKKT